VWDTLSILIFLYIGLPIVLLALLARWGWRWRRETIPPTCRRCGYDVSKRPTARGAV
jgi:hypothetical protein